jgi:hypothetical protein
VASIIGQSGTPANSDYFPYLDLNAGRARFKEEVAGLFFGLGLAPVPVLEMLGVADFSPASVTADPTFERTRRIADAHALHAALTSGSSTQSPDPALIALLRSLRDSCGAASPDLWSDAIHSLAVTTLAFVDAPTAASVLTSAVPETCVDGGLPGKRKWLDLYRAVGARDPARMASTAIALLDGSAPLSPPQRDYALVAGMLGFVASGRPDEGARLWAAHAAKMGGSAVAPEVQLMLGMAPGGATHGGG